jgi:hypothetical protein
MRVHAKQLAFLPLRFREDFAVGGGRTRYSAFA